MSTKDLARKTWDVIVVGAGHNGLSCAAYLAKAKKRVLVLESRQRIGGACSIREPWPGYRISPCAYLAGLLHSLVVEELGLRGVGYEWAPAKGMFVPFEDGNSIHLWKDGDEDGIKEIENFAPHDLPGWIAMSQLKLKLRESLRPKGNRDLWIGAAPSDEEIRDRLGNDPDCLDLLFNWSMAEFLEHYLQDERLHIALMGQGIIGTNASPYEKGTASIHFHHASGRMMDQTGKDQPGTWGYVKGGIGMVSFMLCEVARAHGAVIASGMPVCRIIPGEGVELAGGERIKAPVIISNADPCTTLELLGNDSESEWSEKVNSVPIRGCTLKMNIALAELPDFKARPGTFEEHHRGQINTPLTKPEWKINCNTARRGELPERLWAELYFQTMSDSSVAPLGKHVMSVFAQYVPYEFTDGDWNVRRDEVGNLAIQCIAAHCTNLPGVIENVEIMGPPDIEQEVGLRGGHIFHGECLPAFMWSRRLSPRTPMQGVYLCGAGTYPGGSVIGINGRNAAFAVLEDIS